MGSFPHTRGGGPLYRAAIDLPDEFSPHAWGWTLRIPSFIPMSHVFPTRVGVDPDRSGVKYDMVSFPHTRGGGPIHTICVRKWVLFSPHAWGWTVHSQLRQHYKFVFPTRVGVDLLPRESIVTNKRFPHTRGGGPTRFDSQTRTRLFSPHAWGWTVVLRSMQAETQVFPTRVGVDLA